MRTNLIPVQFIHEESLYILPLTLFIEIITGEKSRIEDPSGRWLLRSEGTYESQIIPEIHYGFSPSPMGMPFSPM